MLLKDCYNAYFLSNFVFLGGPHGRDIMDSHRITGEGIKKDVSVSLHQVT